MFSVGGWSLSPGLRWWPGEARQRYCCGALEGLPLRFPEQSGRVRARCRLGGCPRGDGNPVPREARLTLGLRLEGRMRVHEGVQREAARRVRLGAFRVGAGVAQGGRDKAARRGAWGGDCMKEARGRPAGSPA